VTVAALKRGFLENLFFAQGRVSAAATPNDLYMALAFTIRDRLLHRSVATRQTYLDEASRTVCYLSAEFLLGRQLGNNLVNLGVFEQAESAMSQLGLRLEDLLDQEEEPGLGNGGLGRLAACYLDSLATLGIPSIGYGIRYEFGIFEQEIRDGWQVEVTDKWLKFGNPWEIQRPEIAFYVRFGGRTETIHEESGRFRVFWIPDLVVKGIAHDTPILGYRVDTANVLRLFRAEAVESFDVEIFNLGDYYGAVNQKVVSENITKILYPSDHALQGKALRLQQQYFFVSCALQDMIRVFRHRESNMERFHEKYAVQLNDTHPAVAVAELMRLLVDDYELPWERAWEVTRKTFAYTNHTLMPEALEKWPVALFQSLLPRHLEIIYEINRRFMNDVRMRFPGDDDLPRRLSLIDDTGEPSIRMAHLACVGSEAINGVSRPHTELLKHTVLRDFYDLDPRKFSNKTNGVTPRRFMLLANPGLSRLIDRTIGCGWVTRLEELVELERAMASSRFRADWRAVKQANKRALASLIDQRTGISVDPVSLFDVQIKRIHEYKRQHLNLLHAITLYNRMKRNPDLDLAPRTVIFSGKAAPGYVAAKLIIKLINAVASVINEDREVGGRLRIVFFPNYNVRNAERLFAAIDLSEQISTAGKEASGTGNMKAALNGAVTIGTLDGANIEMREAVGSENFFAFGLSIEQVRDRQASGYRPQEIYDRHAELREAIDRIASGFFSQGDRQIFQPIVRDLLDHDPFMVLADYPSYVASQNEAALAFRDEDRWTRMSILNVARMGYFSSDRAIQEYCRDIWHVEPTRVDVDRAVEPQRSGAIVIDDRDISSTSKHSRQKSS
jgi:starch phosphorylase